MCLVSIVDHLRSTIETLHYYKVGKFQLVTDWSEGLYVNRLAHIDSQKRQNIRDVYYNCKYVQWL